MLRYPTGGIVAGVITLLSCTTEPCACPPSRSRLVVVGMVSQSDQTPVPGATVRFVEQFARPCTVVDGTEQDLESPNGGPYVATTDEAGSYMANLYSTSGPGERCLIVTAVAGIDTAWVRQVARFRWEGELPETLQVAVVEIALAVSGPLQ
jgi:hypothetical protein